MTDTPSRAVPAGRIDRRAVAVRAARVGEVGFRLATLGMTHAVRLGYDWDLRRGPEVAEQTLAKVLARNAGTVYGREHGFAEISDAREFRRRVPLVTYDDLEPYIEDMAERALTNVLCADEVDHFMLTSGTSAKPKLIPTTRHERRRRVPFFVFVPQGTLARSLGPSAVLGRGMNGMSIAATNRHTGAGTPISSSLRIGLGERTWLLRRLFSSPTGAYQVRDVASAYYLHWLFALADRDLRHVTDEFASKMAFSLSVLRGRHEDLAADLESGEIAAELDIDDEARAELAGELSGDPARAAELRAAFAASPDGSGVLPRLWPRLTYVACIYTGTFSVYEEAVRRFAGHLPLFNVGYGMSETIVATSVGPDDPRYLLYPRAGYLEFIHEDHIGLDDPPTLTMDELEPGHLYEIVTTNFGGLYRYRTADVIEVVGRRHRTPVIEFRHRANVLMNFNAEMMTEDVAFGALLDGVGDIGNRLVDYTIRPGAETFPPHYAYYAELAGPVDAAAHARLNDAVERRLGERNPRYEDRVRMGRLLPARVHVVGPGSFSDFELFLGRQAQEAGISHVQTKIPRLLRDPDHVEVLEAHVALRREPPEAGEPGPPAARTRAVQAP